MSNSKPYPIERNSLFFKQWRYCATIYLRHASCLRQLDHNSIRSVVANRNQWGRLRPGITGQISDDELQNLLTMADWLLSRSVPYKKVVSSQTIWIYTNDISQFESVETEVPKANLIQTTEANVVLTPDAVCLTRPHHKFRTYFRYRWLKDIEHEQLTRYFSSRKGLFRLSPGFGQVVSNKTSALQSHHFVDHNEPNADFLIGIACPGVVRKTMPIVPKTK